MGKCNQTVISNLIMDSLRLLILISKFEYRKTFKLTLDKIILYDYFMKFPNTMLNDNEYVTISETDFYEYYSYYHWKPNQNEYLEILNYLMSKGLIDRQIEGNKFFYLSTNDGNDLVNSIQSYYKIKLDKIATFVKSNISKLSESQTENLILEKININKRYNKGDMYVSKHETNKIDINRS